MSTLNRVSSGSLEVFKVSVNEALSVKHSTLGREGNLKTFCTIDAIKNPASAASPNDNISEARGLCDPSQFFDCHFIGATIPFSPIKNTKKPPCDDPSGRLL